jgi:small subunit ribosomal protein S7
MEPRSQEKMRRRVKNKREASSDFLYNSERLEKFTNYVMWSGKKETARRIIYRALDIVKEKTGNPNPLEIFDSALRNASPLTEVRSKRIGGANYQVPREVRPERRQALAMRWIRDAARGKKGAPMHLKLAEELISASKNEGTAVKKKEDTHKMAESNKAFAHFAW